MDEKEKLIFNFSHPLGDQAKAGIRQAVGPFILANVRVQLDLNVPVSDQVRKLVQEAVSLHGRPDYVILPGNNLAAAFVDRYLSTVYDDFPPSVGYTPIIRLVPLAGAVPTFAFGGVE